MQSGIRERGGEPAGEQAGELTPERQLSLIAGLAPELSKAVDAEQLQRGERTPQGRQLSPMAELTQESLKAVNAERLQRGERTPREIRREHRARRDAMTRAEVEEKSRAICEKLLLTGWYRKCRTIYGYYPLGNEVDCRAFLWWALADGKQVALPRMWRTDLRQMDFYRITAPDQVEEGSFHVMEPLPDCALLREETAVVLVPGVVFDEAGGRYGYGKGCYDRYFARFPGLYRVGAAFEHQMELRLSQNKTDVDMNEIHTERRTICGMEVGRAGRSDAENP